MTVLEIQPCFSLLLIFDQISGLCSYKIVLIKNECVYDSTVDFEKTSPG